jgi:hypothetical protein
VTAGNDQVPAWPRGQIAGNGRFQIQARLHSPILAGLDSNRQHFFAADSTGCVVVLSRSDGLWLSGSGRQRSGRVHAEEQLLRDGKTFLWPAHAVNRRPALRRLP